MSLLLSCVDEDEIEMGLCDGIEPYFSIEGIEASPYQRTAVGYPWAAVGTSEVVYSHLYHIGINLVSTFHSFDRTTTGGSNLYALSCRPPGYLGSKEGVDQLFVVTLHDYNDNYAANDTINNIVLYGHRFPSDGDFKPLGEYLEEHKEGVKSGSFLLKLAEPPAEERSNQAFKIIYTLTNGEEFEATTYPVIIRK